jgi:hypothetical protein
VTNEKSPDRYPWDIIFEGTVNLEKGHTVPSPETTPVHIQVSEPPPVIHISTTGNDSYDGRWDRPKATSAAAVAALPAKGGKVVLGPGIFNDTLNDGAKPVTFEGQGPWATEVRGTGVTIARLRCPHGFDATGQNAGSVLKELLIYDPVGDAASLGVLIDADPSAAVGWQLDNVYIKGTGKLGTGLRTRFGLKGEGDGGHVFGWATGVSWESIDPAKPSNANSLVSMKIRGNATGLLVASGTGMVPLVNCTIEGNTLGIDSSAAQLGLVNCHLENLVDADVRIRAGGFRSINTRYAGGVLDLDILAGVAGRIMSLGDQFSAGGIAHNGTGVLLIEQPGVNPTVTGTGRYLLIADHEIKGANWSGVNNLKLGDGFPAVEVLAGILATLGAAGTKAYRSRVTGDAFDRFSAQIGGQLSWGNGSGAEDTNLFRGGAGLLKTSHKLLATLGIGVGNSAAATTPGTVTKKIEVFDASGVSLGFIPVYDAIA